MIHNGTYLGAKTSQNEPPFFCCKKCDYSTCKIGNWKRHLKTKKHNDTQMVHNDTHLGAKRSSTQTAQNGYVDVGNPTSIIVVIIDIRKLVSGMRMMIM